MPGIGCKADICVRAGAQKSRSGAPPPSPQIQALEQVVALVVDDNEGGAVFDPQAGLYR